jgi:AcrR family transcriptional regulator
MKKAALVRKEKIQAEYKKLMLQAAEKVIIRRGYATATMDEVAREAQFSKATLYKYFKNKGELLLEIIIQYIEEIRVRVVEIQQSALEPEKKLKEMILAIMEIQSKKENISRMFMQDKNLRVFIHRLFTPSKGEENRSFQRALKIFKTKREEIFKAGCCVVKEGIDKGQFIKAAPQSIIKFVEAMIEGLLHIRFWENERLSPEEETEQMFRFLMDGISRKHLPKGEKE